MFLCNLLVYWSLSGQGHLWNNLINTPKDESVTIYNKYAFPQQQRPKRYKELLCNSGNNGMQDTTHIV